MENIDLGLDQETSCDVFSVIFIVRSCSFTARQRLKLMFTLKLLVFASLLYSIMFCLSVLYILSCPSSSVQPSSYRPAATILWNWTLHIRLFHLIASPEFSLLRYRFSCQISAFAFVDMLYVSIVFSIELGRQEWTDSVQHMWSF